MKCPLCIFLKYNCLKQKDQKVFNNKIYIYDSGFRIRGYFDSILHALIKCLFRLAYIIVPPNRMTLPHPLMTMEEVIDQKLRTLQQSTLTQEFPCQYIHVF